MSSIAIEFYPVALYCTLLGKEHSPTVTKKMVNVACFISQKRYRFNLYSSGSLTQEDLLITESTNHF